MENLIIPKKPKEPYYPAVNFDAEKGICEISGESYMEETNRFYLPLINWIKEYTEKMDKPIVMNIKLIYFNTSSSRALLEILDHLKNYEDNGGLVTVNWYYDDEDPDMKDEIEDFIIETGLNITMDTL
jgi:hypothetical protein